MNSLLELFDRFALKNGLPLLEYCTLPRTGALEIIMQVLGPESVEIQNQKNTIISEQEKSLSEKMTRTGTNGSQSPGLLLNERNNETIATNSYSGANTEDLKNLNDDDIPDTRDVVTNNNQTKWNTKRYFR